MTINIALATSEAIVLGCDSLSSVVEPIFHTRDITLAMKDGEPLLDDNGQPCFTGSITHSVTSVFGGVRKMCCIWEHNGFHVAAVTAGLAILDGMTIAEHASEFRRKKIDGLNTVEQVAAAFLNHIREKWEITVNYQESSDIDTLGPGYPNVEFLVAGFEPTGEGRVYRLDICANSMQLQYDGQPGIAWAGQANFVQRLLMGADVRLRDALIHSGIEETKLVDAMQVSRTNIDFANLPTQYAIDFVEMLVNTQSGMQRFEPGIATVGGRTHIGVLRRGERFQMLNEPELVHKHTGFNHDD